MFNAPIWCTCHFCHVLSVVNASIWRCCHFLHSPRPNQCFNMTLLLLLAIDLPRVIASIPTTVVAEVSTMSAKVMSRSRLSQCFSLTSVNIKVSPHLGHPQSMQRSLPRLTAEVSTRPTLYSLIFRGLNEVQINGVE